MKDEYRAGLRAQLEEIESRKAAAKLAAVRLRKARVGDEAPVLWWFATARLISMILSY